MPHWKIKRVIDVEITPAEMAYVFANMRDEEQADFFNRCGTEFKKFYGDLQLCYMEEYLTYEGRRFIENIKVWAKGE